mmetsp:Transcript_8987/g.22704  ORF Transcript_8987/g.22704 Transcript_8987/m.22704 type:complete len:241 (+) Transcript_8987:64-786(+)
MPGHTCCPCVPGNHFFAVRPEGAAMNFSPEKADRIELVIRRLRGLEQNVGHQAKLAQAVNQATADLDYSDENFAYGSTPFCSWAKVISYPKVQEALPAAMHGGRNYTVWGSSCGWLVFFGCVAMAWPSIGYELLSCLHQSSEALREELSLSAEQACFVCADMLSSSLTNTGLLIMANQCWDSDLMHQAGAKAVAELPQNAMCIEYTGALAKTQMRLLASVAAPVSWKPGGISFHVWVKDS